MKEFFKNRASKQTSSKKYDIGKGGFRDTGNYLMNPVFGPGQYRIFLVLPRAEKAVLISAELRNQYDTCSFDRIRANLIILFNKVQYLRKEYQDWRMKKID